MSNYKLSIFLICSLFVSFNGFSQNIEPTMTEAVLNVKVISETGGPSIGDTIHFTASSGEKYFGVSNIEGGFSLLIPNGQMYTTTYKDRNGDELSMPIEIAGNELIEINWELKFELPKLYTLDNVFFDLGKTSLRSESYTELNELVEIMKIKEAMQIEIGGHTDNIGDEATNQRISDGRAKSVKSYLVEKGISTNRVNAVGYGESKPIASNDTEEGKQKNRRTEVKILSK